MMTGLSSWRHWRRALQGGLFALALAAAPARAASEPLVGADRIVDVTFHSTVLGRDKTYTVVVPAGDGSAPVLFLLHGRGRNHRSLVDRVDTRAVLLSQSFYIVLPDGEDGWYIDSPVDKASRYETYLAEVMGSAEVHYPLARDPARRAIGGWSMGGYGAAHFATTHPGRFAALVSIVGLLDFPRPETLPTGRNYHVPVERFGTDPALWRSLNPVEHIASLGGTRVLAITGSESFDLLMNRNFISRARERGLDCRLIELAGGHTIETVAEALPIAMQFVRETFATAPPARHPPASQIP